MLYLPLYEMMKWGGELSIGVFGRVWGALANWRKQNARFLCIHRLHLPNRGGWIGVTIGGEKGGVTFS